MKYIFWTGGWDSTFRLLQLAERDIEIYPIYVYDANRASKEKEIESMNKILSLISKDKRFRAKIMPIDIYDKNFILSNFANDEISLAWKRANENFSLGSQYEWLALLCKEKEIKVELGLEASNRSKALNVINAGGGYKKCEEYFILQDSIQDDVSKFFGYYEFGIINLTKYEMYKISKERKWWYIMKNTWFCHTPIKGTPCGCCNPCKDVMNENMKFRMPLLSKFRYYKNLITTFRRR